MSATAFEGSYLGDRARLRADARLECKICWWVYDPAAGDAQWQVPPGTPFDALPSHWRWWESPLPHGTAAGTTDRMTPRLPKAAGSRTFATSATSEAPP